MLALSVCSRCRYTLWGTNSESWTTLTSLSSRRHRSNKAANSPSIKSTKPSGGLKTSSSRFKPQRNPYISSSRPHQPWRQANDRPWSVTNPKTSYKIDDPNTFFTTEVKRWSQSRDVLRRLESFGIPPEDIPPLLKSYVHAVQSGQLNTNEGYELYGLARLKQGSLRANIDVIYSTTLFIWASQPKHEGLLQDAGVPTSTISQIQALARAADRSYPAEEFVSARKMRRKVIMHVGPTNSGKTHNALRALAASSSGVYAGPLRLLAHEIWERLNLGQIVPLGMEEDAPIRVTDVDTDSALDVGGGVEGKKTMVGVRKLGNPKYARKCNMRTGEEQKIVDESAPLLSCTVEMLSLHKPYDVAVVDEIQMIADENRGNGWTAAVLGLCAKELHLCGEETAVPLVRELLKDTGDEVVVNRYERLTPLNVDEGLDSDLSRVRRGDCIVTFSRHNIFSLKQQIERSTPMRCAVVYGMLPPEIRSEQAALFNDPDSGYDVIIGSDAIGMGLNLKIRRVIFEAVIKWDGAAERNLSISQTKQIAGRAGRYGLHEDGQPGGYATTLKTKDVDFLRKALNTPFQPLPFARIGLTKESFAKLFSVMPPNSSTRAFFDAHQYISRLPPIVRYAETAGRALQEMCEFVDEWAAELPLADRLTLIMAPIPWRDPAGLVLIKSFLNMFKEEMSIDLAAALENTTFLANLEEIEGQMNSSVNPRVNPDKLKSLESFHKSLVMYLWMSFRQPVVWNGHTQVVELKERVEKALDWTLQAMTKNTLRIQTRKTERKSIKYATMLDQRQEMLTRVSG